MLCDAELFLECDCAELIAKALSVDDPTWCRSEGEGKILRIKIKTERVESLLSACEDYFRTLRAAVNALESLKKFEYGANRLK